MGVLVLQIDEFLVHTFKSLLRHLRFRHLQRGACTLVHLLVLLQFLTEQVYETLLVFDVVHQLFQGVAHFVRIRHVWLLQYNARSVLQLLQLVPLQVEVRG